MNKIRLNFLVYTLTLIFGMLGFRMYYIQVWKYGHYKKMAGRQYITYKNVSTLRGRILDRKKRVLAFSSFRDSCYADPGLIEHPAAVAEHILPFLDGDVKSIQKKLLTPGRRFVWLKRRMPTEEAERLKQLNIKGIGFIREEKRFYPHEDLAGHLLGMLGSDNQALSGIEYAADEILTGKVSTKKTSRDALGKEISIGCVDAEKGNFDIAVTIDRTIQYIAEAELHKTVEATGAQKGVVIVQEPFSGDILAMAVSPRLNMHECMAVGELYNHAISGVWEPGSTLKVMSVAAALEEGVVSVKDSFDCEQGNYRVQDRIIHDHTKHGVLSVRDIVAQSSNIGVAKICSRLSKEKMYRYLRAFGFGSYSGIPIAGEAKGIFRAPRYWSGVSLSMLSFGHEIGVTPIQMISAYSAIANGGYLMQPRIIKSIIDGDEKEVWASEVVSVRRVVRDETVGILKHFLETAVEDGTGMAARVKGFSVCGKTGTAQQIDKKTREYSSEKYLASFCGFLPAKKPRVSILVFIDSPKGIYWGGVVAAPVFSRIASRIMAYLNVPPDKMDEKHTPERQHYVSTAKIN